VSLIFAGFLIILLLTFAVMVMVTRPTRTEKALEERLSTISRSRLSERIESTAVSRLMKSGLRSGSPWVGDFLERYEVARKIQSLIVQSDSKITPERLALITVGFGCGGFFLSCLFVHFFPVQLLIAVGVGALPFLRLVHKRSKRLKAFNVELSKAVDMMSNALRAGHSVVGAIGILSEQTAEPAQTEFKEVFRQQNFGLPLREALMQLLDRVPSEDLRVVVTAILVQKETGGNLGDILDRTVFVIRERVRIRGEIQVQTAQGRLTGVVLSLLPLVLLLVINIINPGYSAILLDDPLGRKLIYIGMALLATGMLVIRHMINKIEV
jgi:tight adherence protein B